ncbi:MAG: GGDEF domain-containing protein [Desulfarculus sp.]|nr:GGDEF domain-containing protein [Pseudomonadota bacterium]MBU4597942.1 GGDEF domain-containing protein [Pseudomonadota bacterium]MBV1714387.1 GGDEF domain-containing protein [Desulfarculus sp.]MBV1738243.1 GGDEF domain-containing protein [Desulfarculus sp.]
MLLPAMHDPKQVLRLKRTLLAIAGGAVHTFLCWVFLEWNFFRATALEFFLLFGFFWLVHLSFPVMMLLGINQCFKDPSLTLYQMAWATICVMITLYFIYDLRMVVLMYYLLVMIFGAFRLRLKEFLIISAIAVVGYGLVIFAMFYNQVEILNLRVEYVQWLCFSVVMTTFALLGANLSALRRKYRKQSELLSKAMDKISLLVETDELTGLWNRRHAMRFLQGQKALAERGGYGFSICYLDLDHFKDVNDRFGHHWGDVVLKTTSQVMGGLLREIDCLARFGGEEFLVVLPLANQAAAVTVGQRLLEKVRLMVFEGALSGLRVTLSMGIAEFIPGETVDDLLHRADQAMYQAKNQGRNQVEVAGPQ